MKPPAASLFPAARRGGFFLALWLAAGAQPLAAREWRFVGIPKPLEAELVTVENGAVVLKGPNGKSFEVPLTSFSPADREYLKIIERGGAPPESADPQRPITSRSGYKVSTVKSLGGQVTGLPRGSELRVAGGGDLLAGGSVHFTSPESWLIFEDVRPGVVEKDYLDRMLVGGRKAKSGVNVRVVQHGRGAIVIPQPPDFPAMTVYDAKELAGGSMPLIAHQPYNDARLKKMKDAISSFVLRRGYMATLAENADGTGASMNVVAQDHDVVVGSLPAGLERGVSFVRIFPWRWTGKKGIAGGIGEKLEIDWFYNWNISDQSTPGVEYVPIAQKLGWPNLDQDWEKRGSLHLLGFNEPDRPDQANLKVDDALKAWPALLATGLRLGAPAVSDGGLGWLYDFMKKADAAGLRVDFVPVHYYRATADPGDAKGAADQLHRFVKEIHDRTGRPVWLTEWNNGANWTKAPDPNDRQQAAAVAAMIEMLDKTPFVERYALYNWVEPCRELVRKDGSLTPAGEVYRDDKAPLAFGQPRSSR